MAEVKADKPEEAGEAERIKVGIYLPRPLVDRLRHMRVDTGRSVSGIVQEAVDRYLDPPIALHLAGLPDEVGATCASP